MREQWREAAVRFDVISLRTVIEILIHDDIRDLYNLIRKNELLIIIIKTHELFNIKNNIWI